MKDPAGPREDASEAAMSARRAAAFLALVTLVTGARPRAGRAAESPCDAVTVALDPEVQARWPELAARLGSALAGRGDVDRCARVRLVARGEAAALVVSLPDGRSTERPVSRLEDVLPLVEALVLVPMAPPVAESPAPPRQAVVAAPEPAVITAQPAPAPTVSSEPAPRPMRLELSFLTGARVGGVQTSVGFGLLGQVVLRGWLIGLEARLDRYQYRDRDAPLPALELVLLGGRRWWLGGAVLDVGGGLAAVYQGVSTVEVQTLDGHRMSQSSQRTLPRVRLGVRLGFLASASLRPFVGLEGEVGPLRAPGGLLADAPYLPRGTVGLIAGATVGSP
jgi:hypothetical protein